MWVRVPLWPHMRQAKFCLRVCQVFFSRGFPVFAHLLIGPSHMSCNNLERDVKLNLKKKKTTNKQTKTRRHRSTKTEHYKISKWLYLSRLMGKQTICICENKGADQLRGNREADQRLCFRYADSTIPPLLNSKISSF